MKLLISLKLPEFLHDSFEYKRILGLFNTLSSNNSMVLTYEIPAPGASMGPNLLYQERYNGYTSCNIICFSRTRLFNSAFLQKDPEMDPGLSKKV